MDKVYLRRADRIGRLFRRRVRAYEVWRPDAPPVPVSFAALDRRLEARRYPADFWAAVGAADDALAAGDPCWIESVTGRSVADPSL